MSTVSHFAPAGLRQTPAQVSSVQQDPEVNNGLRKLGWWFCLLLLFLRATRLIDYLSEAGVPTTGVLYIVTIPALVLMLSTGGLRRAFSHSIGRYWGLFVIWMVLAIPFSTWRGGSVDVVYTYVKTDFLVLVLMAGLPLTWKEWRAGINTLAISAVISVVLSLFYGQDIGGGRLGLTNATIGNPNDYAGHLLYLLPFAAFMMIHPPRNLFLGAPIRVLMGITLLYGVYLILASGSRGAFLALLGVTGFLFLKAPFKIRIASVVLVPVVAGIMIAVLPSDVLSRLMSYSADTRVTNDVTTQSTALRRELFLDSLRVTITHPIFGVGPGEFGNFDDKSTSYTDAHNSYTQISADSGLPGFCFFMAGVVGPFLLVQRLWKKARDNPKKYPSELPSALLCLSVTWIGFCLAISFLNFAYFFYLPAFAAITISLQKALERYTSQQAPVPAMASTRFRAPLVTPAAPPPVAVPDRPSRGVSQQLPFTPGRRMGFNGYRRNRQNA